MEGDAAQEPPRYDDLARQLFPVARLFESLGFLSVAREVAYVEKALAGLAPGDARRAETPSVPTHRASSSATRGGPAPAVPEPAVPEQPELPDRPTRRLPRPVAAMLLLLLLAILGAVIVVQFQAEHGWGTVPDREPTSPAALPVPTTVVPTPSSPPPPLPSPTESEPRGAAIVAEQIAQARLALAQGDVDRAIHHVSAAALIDLSSSLVLETGQVIVRELLARSDAAADAGRWQDAAALLERARELSIRFSFPVSLIDETAKRHDSMERFVVIVPTDTAAIRDAAGRRVLVIYQDGRRREGRIHGVHGEILELDQFTQVGSGGRVYYVDEVPLAKVRELRVYGE